MKKCADCGADATFLLEEDGAERAVCNACLSRITGVMGISTMLLQMLPPRHPATICPHCGTSLSQLQETGMAGCPLCYEVFPRSAYEAFGVYKA